MQIIFALAAVYSKAQTLSEIPVISVSSILVVSDAWSAFGTFEMSVTGTLMSEIKQKMLGMLEVGNTVCCTGSKLDIKCSNYC